MRVIFDKKTIYTLYLIILIIIIPTIFFYMAVIKFKIINSLSGMGLFHLMLFILPYLFAIYIINSIKFKDHRKFFSTDSSNNYPFKKELLYLFIIVYSLSIIYLNFIYEKEIIYIILLTTLYLIIFFQVIGTQTNPVLIIAELILTFINSTFSVNFLNSFYFGKSDTFLHIDYATIIFNSGRLLPAELGYPYVNYPVLHILISTGSHILNISLIKSNFLLTSLIFPLSIIFIFCIFRFLIGERIALLGCLLYSTTSEIVTSGLPTNPYCVAFIYFNILFFLIVKINSKNKNKVIFYGLLIPIVVVLIYTHHASLFLILGIFLIFYLSIALFQYFTQETEKFNPFPIILVTIAFAVHWFYAATVLSRSMMWQVQFFLNENELLDSISIAPIDTPISYGIFEGNNFFLISNLPFCILMFFILIGIGFVIKQKFQKYLWGYAIIAFFFFPLYLPLATDYLKTLSEYAANRFILYTSPIIMIIFAIGFYFILNYRSKYPKKYIIIALTLVFIIYSFTGLINIAGYDYKYIPFSDPYSSYFNKEDIASINFFDKYTENDATILSDYIPYRYFLMKNYNTMEDIGLRYYQIQILKNIGSNSEEVGYIFYRNGELKKNNYLILASQRVPYNEHELFEQSFFYSNKIVNMDKNKIYLNSALS